MTNLSEIQLSAPKHPTPAEKLRSKVRKEYRLSVSTRIGTTFHAVKPSNDWMLEAIMTNVNFGSQAVPANKGDTVVPPSSVPTHVGGHKVRIDTVALKHLIDTLKAKLRIRG
jgi:hypothetical protein